MILALRMAEKPGLAALTGGWAAAYWAVASRLTTAVNHLQY